MKGYRKLIVVILVVAAAAFVEVNEHQASVLIAVLCTFVVGNSVEHMKGSEIHEKVVGLVGRLRGDSDPDPNDGEKEGRDVPRH